jgi:hypothetical protein
MGDNKPDCVVIQWPDFTRYSFMTKQNHLLYYNSGSVVDALHKELIISNVLESTNVFVRHLLLNYIDNLGIKKIIEFIVDPNLAAENRIKTHIATNCLSSAIDTARDLAHPGTMAHAKQSKEILRVINLM